jgi:hypothetical protein
MWQPDSPAASNPPVEVAVRSEAKGFRPAHKSRSDLMAPRPMRRLDWMPTVASPSRGNDSGFPLRAQPRYSTASMTRSAIV